ncbi:hypothetical protein F5X96DRAFT_507114 [Biscogniauxia mediterranea]|nr:hypothetical protein F5X96DRAFT_507114 [Biscogniauxia mediterranea]
MKEKASNRGVGVVLHLHTSVVFLILPFIFAFSKELGSNQIIIRSIIFLLYISRIAYSHPSVSHQIHAF